MWHLTSIYLVSNGGQHGWRTFCDDCGWHGPRIAAHPREIAGEGHQHRLEALAAQQPDPPAAEQPLFRPEYPGR